MIKLFCSMILMTLLVGCNSVETSRVSSTPYTGDISPSQLLRDIPHFAKEYHNYQPKPAEVLAAQALSGKSILVLFGTWCHDSEREVPRLLKLLDVAAVKLQNLTIHGVNYNKQSPTNLHREHSLNFTPTFILFDEGKELGRVIEKPKISLGEDLASYFGK